MSKNTRTFRFTNEDVEFLLAILNDTEQNTTLITTASKVSFKQRLSRIRKKLEVVHND